MAENLLSSSEIFSYPYVVSKDYAKSSQFLQEVPSYDSTLKDTVDDLRSLMYVLANKEKQKENNFVQAYLYTIREKDTNLYFELSSLFAQRDNPAAISQAIDAVQKYRMGMYDVVKTIKENAATFSETWSAIANKVFVDALYNFKFDNMDIMNLTIDDLLKTAGQRIVDEYSGQISVDSKVYQNFVNKVLGSVREMAHTKFGDDYSKTFAQLESNPYIQSVKKKHRTEGKTEKVEEIIKGYLFGIVNGLSAEAFLEFNKSGKSTARITQKQKSLSNRSGYGQVAIQTDVIEIVNSTFTIALPEQDELEQRQIETADQLYDWLGKIDLEDKFVIHTSVKDQSTNRNYNNGKALSIDVRKEASLDARLEPLKSICEQVSLGKRELENLIFAVVNAGEYMVSNDLYKSGQIVKGLTAVCAAYMFEDYIDTFAQFDSEQDTNDALHVYFINGKYYTLSTILTLAANELDFGNSKSNRIVQINFRPLKERNIFEEVPENLIGRERWDWVRGETLSGGKMSMRLNTRALLNQIYGNK